MKIAYIIPYNWGGMIHYTSELANAVSNYADVVVLGNKDLPKEYFSENIETIAVFENLNFSVTNPKTILTYNNLKALLSFRKIYIINKLNPDLIHFTMPLLHIPIFISFFGIDKKYPMIYTLHSPYQDDKPSMEIFGYLNRLLRNLLTYKKLIVHSQRDKEKLVQKSTYPEKDIVVIPHGTYNIFNKNNPLSKTIPMNKNCIIFFGYIKKYKGLEYLIGAIPYILKEISDLNVIIAGEGDISYYYYLIDDCPSIHDHLEIHNKFIPDNEVSILFQRASLVVLPYSQMTGQSGVITIAYSFGKPVVSTKVWAFHEVLEDGITGYLVPPKDPEALAEAIIKILKDDKLRAFMGNNAFKIGQELSWENIAKKHIAIYKDIIK